MTGLRMRSPKKIGTINTKNLHPAALKKSVTYNLMTNNTHNLI